MRMGGVRRLAVRGSVQERASEGDIALAYDIAEPGARAPGTESLGPPPILVRPLSALGIPLLFPLGPSRAGVREITVREPRMTRLWERFCVDVDVAVERDAKYFDARVFARMNERGYRVLIMEDGDRYAVRAACVFTVQGRAGHVLELLHDRSVAGMRGASRLLGLALREMKGAGANAASAWSLPHSGSFPLFALHAFFPLSASAARQRDPRELVVRAIDPELEGIVSERERWYVSLLDDDRI